MPQPNQLTRVDENARQSAEHVSERRLKAALVKHDGSYAHAAKELGCSRQAVFARVQRNPHLREFLKEVFDEHGDMVVSNIIDLCRAKDGAMLRFYADRKLRDRGFGNPVNTKSGPAPSDPEAAARRANAMKIVGAMIEDRARLGLRRCSPSPRRRRR